MKPHEALERGLCVTCAASGRETPAGNGMCPPCQERLAGSLGAQGATVTVSVVHEDGQVRAKLAAALDAATEAWGACNKSPEHHTYLPDLQKIIGELRHMARMG